MFAQQCKVEVQVCIHVKTSHSLLSLAYNLSCTALTVRGLNNARKRRQVFRWLHERMFQVIFLQEVYSSRNLERVWSAEWGGKVVYSHGSKHSSGTLVLFNPSLDVAVENHETDQRGRLIILRAKIDEIQVYFYPCMFMRRMIKNAVGIFLKL